VRWKKLGQLYQPRLTHPKLISHAANPLAVSLGDDIFRVYYSGRDSQNRSSVSYLDLDLVRRHITYVHDRPVFEYGADGSFYSHGVSIGNCYHAGGKHYMLFMGWQCPPGEHWRGEIGRLILAADGSLQLDSEQPFLGINNHDPVSLSYPWVSGDERQGYTMWYGSTLAWDAGNGEMLHVIKQAHSPDGQLWQRQQVAIPYELGVAQAFSRPTVIRNELQDWHMWFSFRSGSGTTYRIGHAASNDGRHWQRRLETALLDVSASGWDSEMTAYPYVFSHKGKFYMLYNGNGYGLTGFGLAILED